MRCDCLLGQHVNPLKVEQEENEMRKELTVSERVALANAIQGRLKKVAGLIDRHKRESGTVDDTEHRASGIDPLNISRGSRS